MDQSQIEQVIRSFHELYYSMGQSGRGTWMKTFWMGVPLAKCPLDLWIYQELIHAIRPKLIVETGTAFGGTALYLANLCDLLGIGDVVTIETVARPTLRQHARISYLSGSSADPAIVREIHQRAAGKSPVMVILDSDHHHDHVLAELRAYHDLVTAGSYLIVEDTNVNGRPVLPGFGPGPLEAIDAFLSENRDFEIDRACEKFLMTFSPLGFLRKRQPA